MPILYGVRRKKAQMPTSPVWRLGSLRGDIHALLLYPS